VTSVVAERGGVYMAEKEMMQRNVEEFERLTELDIINE
jgi:hypothetical protein